MQEDNTYGFYLSFSGSLSASPAFAAVEPYVLDLVLLVPHMPNFLMEVTPIEVNKASF
jgi:hypothetical protein